jgi:hypothetical protein
MKRTILVCILILCISKQAFGWGTTGHEVVAYIAYQQLTQAQRKRIDALVKLNPCYSEWQQTVASLPAGQQSAGLYMLAATWPDRIKLTPTRTSPGYDCQKNLTFIKDGGDDATGKFSADIPPNVPEASQNIGYDDTRRHQYWHFVDTPLSTDGTAIIPAYTPNALTMIGVLSQAINSGEPDLLKSYDLVWITHLVGDLHQPLHDTTRFSARFPNGDQGGNLVLICAQAANCDSELHGYWDDLPGSGNLAAAIKIGTKLSAKPTPTKAAVADPKVWVQEGFTLAQSTAYAAPYSDMSAGGGPQVPGTTYRKNAVPVVNAQLILAGHRLGNLLQANLR